MCNITASKCGIIADSTGTISPHIPSNEAAHIDLSKLDLPPPFGPVKRNNDFIVTLFCIALPCATSNQYGDKLISSSELATSGDPSLV